MGLAALAAGEDARAEAGAPIAGAGAQPSGQIRLAPAHRAATAVP